MLLKGEWRKVLDEELKKPYITEIEQFVKNERQTHTVYPTDQEVFAALNHTPFSQVKVVIIGQDPYHGPGQAHGFSFSVPEGVPPPPSLVNIYKELAQDLGIPVAKTGSLLKWADQGVLLLNATLTVRQGQAKSHYGKGWERFTNQVVATLAEREDPLAFILWGRSAIDKFALATQQGKNLRHFIVTSPHPSPLSAHQGFLGSRPFSKVNRFLENIGKTPIDWNPV